MSIPSFGEFFLICVIGLIVLGPKRLPEVASKIGGWVGQARRMTRTLKRQLDEELNLEKQLNIDPDFHPLPNDDDTYSPMHASPPSMAGVNVSARSSEKQDIDPDELDIDSEDVPAVEDDAETQRTKQDDEQRDKA